jgi:transcriptional regulator with GAF, ATPase, and Fis domain
MLWIGSCGRDTLIGEVEEKTGLKAVFSDGRTSRWRKDMERAEVVVIHLPAPAEVVREVLEAAGHRLPVVIRDPENSLDESLIGPPLASFRHLIGERDVEDLAAVVRSAVERGRSAGLGDPEPWRGMLIGESQAMRELRMLVGLTAPRQSTVLVTGESGTGKELVARAIHMASKRSAAELVPVNCGALPENLIEAELFGHVKGAFTGAVGNRTGRFEQAHRGTIFLDEVGEIPLPLQPKLLRVLQERQFQRVGSSETVQVDTRIVAASNIDLDLAVSQKRFREDLYYRLNVVPIRVPPLRERLSDVPLLAAHFIKNVCEREDLPAKRLTDSAMARLMEYGWPGNVRQLEHAIEMAVTLSGDRETIYLGDISLPERSPALPKEAEFRLPAGGVRLDEVMGRVEKLLLDQALESCGGNKAKAARALGLKRTTLIYKMKALEGQNCGADRLVCAGPPGPAR